MLPHVLPSRPVLETSNAWLPSRDQNWTSAEINDLEPSMWMLFLRDMLHYAIENENTEMFKGLKKWRSAKWDNALLADCYPACLRSKLPSFLDTRFSAPFRHPGNVANEIEVQATIASAIMFDALGAFRPFLIQVWKLLFPGRELAEVQQYWVWVKKARQVDGSRIITWLDNVVPGINWREDSIMEPIEPKNKRKLEEVHRHLQNTKEGKNYKQ